MARYRPPRGFDPSPLDPLHLSGLILQQKSIIRSRHNDWQEMMTRNFDFMDRETEIPVNFETPEEMKIVQSLFGAAMALEKAHTESVDSPELVQVAYAWIDLARAWGKKSRDELRQEVARTLVDQQ
jgi:hypothetical protein